MNRTRNTVLTVLFLCLSISSFAQFGVPNLLKYDKKRLHFGFLFGYNLFDFSISSKPNLADYDSLMAINTRAISGASLGIVTNLRLGKYFDLRFIPSLSFGAPYMRYGIRSSETGNIYWYPPNHRTDPPQPDNLDAVCIDLPILFKYKSSRMLNNIRAYVITGGQASFNVISNKGKKSSGAGVILQLRRFDIQAQAGFGFDFYCTYFKFSTEVKMSFGLINVLAKENKYVNSINWLRAKNLQISFIFE
jgi:hypothetical protein